MKRGRRAATQRALVASLVVPLILGVLSATAVAAPALDLRVRLLVVSDLPAGWHSEPPEATQLALASAPCLRALAARPASGKKRATASFSQGSGLPAFVEVLSAGETAAVFHKAVDALGRCHRLTLTIGGKQVKASISRLSLSVPGSTSHAFSLTLVANGVSIVGDVMLFRTRAIVGEAVYLAVGPPTPATAEALAQVAISKAEGHAVSPPHMVSVVSSPVDSARTALGTVGYRVVGSGPPLVMIMGFAGTMETWDPRFVDALAHDHEVVILDNAGIGQTHSLAAPLTIDEMAQQTSALIIALGLGRTDVLGWSMGTMIAQALTVLHPTQVNRLVLCAGYPGTGTVEPAQKAIRALTKGSPAQALAELFPANQRIAATGYEVSVSAWPESSPAPSGVVAAQEGAIVNWWKGTDRAGKRASAISAPTLILDGTPDRLDPQRNAHTLKTQIHGAELTLYHDAGHAFLFQDEAVVVPRIESFLHG